MQKLKTTERDLAVAQMFHFLSKRPCKPT